jgi:Dyp-type peroxidase family
MRRLSVASRVGETRPPRMVFDQSTATAELDLQDIQGNVVPGFNNDHQAFLFVAFRDGGQARTWLRDLQPEITSALEVNAVRIAFRSMRQRLPAAANSNQAETPIRTTWINVALSFAGLRLLPRARGVSSFSSAFQSDRAPGAEPLAPPHDVHALLIVAADTATDLEAELQRQAERTATQGIIQLKLLRGDTLPGDLRGHEHFGFKDGISQPFVAGLSSGPPPAVAPGEFIIGLADQSGSPSGASLPAWTRNGSFVAFVQLQQHVEAFWRAMRQHSRTLGIPPEELAAQIVGRKRDALGTLVSNPPSPYSHIGRAYSRWLGAAALRHRILRRGIAYGAPWKEGEPDDGQRGILFVTYQADLATQFEYVWRLWLNGANHPTLAAGRDGLTGQLVQPAAGSPVPAWSDHALRPAIIDTGPQKRGLIPVALPGFVTPRASGYFFAPSISGLCALSESTTPQPNLRR